MRKKLLFPALFLFAIVFMVACSAKPESKVQDEATIARLSDSPEAQIPPEKQIYQAGEARYEPYSPERLEVLKEKKRFAVFFHADWCPLCRNLETDLLENLEDMGPLIILRADYDEELALRKEYSVVAQTTFLFFDQEGEVLYKKINPSFDFIQDFFNS